MSIDNWCLLGEDELEIELPEFLLPDARQEHTEWLAEILTSMGIAEVEHPTIIDKIFRAVEQAEVPGPPLICFMVDGALTLLGIDCLEKVRPDSLEDTARQDKCAICRDCLDHQFEGVEEEGVENHVTRLPCLHLFHGDCIVSWLQMRHSCPFCRYPMPPIEVEAAHEVMEEAPGWRRNWPMLLAGGTLTAILVCRLWKQAE